jgi:uncharacterized protein (TIGR02266 family)
MAVHRYVKTSASITNRRTDVRSRLEIEVQVLVKVPAARAPLRDVVPPVRDVAPPVRDVAPPVLDVVPQIEELAPLDLESPGLEIGILDVDPVPDPDPDALFLDDFPGAASDGATGDDASFASMPALDAPAIAQARADMDVDVGLETESNFYTGLSQDISAGGVFVATSRVLPVGECITVRFSIPEWQTPIVARAEVRWTREVAAIDQLDAPTGMGLRFVGLSEDARGAIARFIEQRDAIFYDDE